MPIDNDIGNDMPIRHAVWKKAGPDLRVDELVTERLAPQVVQIRTGATLAAGRSGFQADYTIDRAGAPYHPLYQRPVVFATTMDDVVTQILQEDGR